MYKNLIETKSKSLTEIQIPETFVPEPIESDYENGFIERYFIQKANDNSSFVFEINDIIANKIFSNPYWKQIVVIWRISGPIDVIKNEKTGIIIDNGVYNDNIKEIAKAKKQIPNIGSYLINPMQFYKGRIS